MISSYPTSVTYKDAIFLLSFEKAVFLNSEMQVCTAQPLSEMTTFLNSRKFQMKVVG